MIPPTAPTNLDALFAPRAVAVIGASRRESSLGYRTLRALLAGGFTGPVYPVNPNARVVGSIRTVPRVGDIPDDVDLAVILVPRELVQGVVEECAAKGVRGLVVMTAGYAETGAEGRRLQEALVATARHHGMRLVGPNCMGLLSTDPAVRLNATFASVVPEAGGLAMLSQSGALGLSILRLASQRGLGLSSFVSVGNKADVSANDLLEYWEADPRTSAILLYLESFGNPANFARIAQRVTRHKPVIAVKGGRTVSGQRAAGSHTAALAGSNAGADALFRQTGVLRADTLNEMFDIALAFETQSLPAGTRVALVTNAGGPGILCADACESGGLEVVQLTEATRAAVVQALPAMAAVNNPVDMVASAEPADYAAVVGTLLAAPEVDGLIAMYTPVELGREREYLDGIAAGIAVGRAASSTAKPVLLNALADEGIARPLAMAGERVPVYPFPEQAARAMARLAEYAQVLQRPVGTLREFADTDFAGTRAGVLAVLRSHGPGWLGAEEIRDVLAGAGLPRLPGGFAATADEAAELATTVGYPVAVKLASRTIVHKTEYDAVRLNLRDAQAVRDAYHGIQAGLAARRKADAMDGLLVQPMIQGGVELMAGMTRDPSFGPLLTFGLGGIHVELLRDVAFRVAPLTDRNARGMVRELRGYPLLEGYRGHAPADIAALEELIQRLSRLVEAVPEIMELDLNPVFALAPGRGCVIVDARIRVAEPMRPPED